VDHQAGTCAIAVVFAGLFCWHQAAIFSAAYCLCFWFCVSVVCWLCRLEPGFEVAEPYTSKKMKSSAAGKDGKCTIS
jgi:hypothetical protein